MRKIFALLCIFLCLGSFRAIYGAPSEEISDKRVYPVVVLGGGVGALTSAIYLQRAGIETIVIEGQTPGGAIAQSPMVHNWPGEIEIDGSTLVDRIRKQAEFNGARILSYEVIGVDFTKLPLAIKLRNIQDPEHIRTIYAKSCIVALGANPKLLGIPGESGEKGYWTRGVYNCAVCDGALFKDKTVAVVGSGDTAILEADYLSKLAKKVYLVIRSKDFRTAEVKRKEELLKKNNIELIKETNVTEIQGDGKKVTHMILTHKTSMKKQVPVDGVFIAIGSKPNTDIFAGQLKLDERGYIVLTNGQQTSVERVFGIGDAVDPYYKQAISAAGDGAKAALQVERCLAISEEQLPPLMLEKPHVVMIDNPTSSSVAAINSSEEFYQEIHNSSVPILVDFYSPFCGPCKRLGPEFDKASQQYAGKLKFIKINIATATELATNYNIYAVPTVIVFDSKGNELERSTGEGEIKKLLKKLDKIAEQK